MQDILPNSSYKQIDPSGISREWMKFFEREYSIFPRNRRYRSIFVRRYLFRYLFVQPPIISIICLFTRRTCGRSSVSHCPMDYNARDAPGAALLAESRYAPIRGGPQDDPRDFGRGTRIRPPGEGTHDQRRFVLGKRRPKTKEDETSSERKSRFSTATFGCSAGEKDNTHWHSNSA